MEAQRKNKYIEITNDFYNLVVNSNIIPKSKYSTTIKAELIIH